MTPDEMKRRLEALQRRLNADRPAGTAAHGVLLCVVTHGCLPPGVPLFAMAGEHEWLRGPEEDLDAFADRAKAGAREAGEQRLVLGGLPRSPAQHEVAQAAHAAWLLTDDGVPPMEESRGVPSPVQRAIERRDIDR
jgi:hypothetical protein